MRIVIDNIEFPFDMGCRLLKLKDSECPYPMLAEFWDANEPYTFKAIAQFNNAEHRRVGVLCLGLDRLINEVNPELIATQTVPKKTTWINAKGELETVDFKDTYQLYKVSGDYFTPKGTPNWQRFNDVYYIQFKDTSTDRMYLLWVDVMSVYRTNYAGVMYNGFASNPVTPIQSIAWTITTTVPKGNIEKIIRQGDCIMVKPIDSLVPLLDKPRHLTEDEYLALLVAES